METEMEKSTDSTMATNHRTDSEKGSRKPTERPMETEMVICSEISTDFVTERPKGFWMVINWHSCWLSKKHLPMERAMG